MPRGNGSPCFDGACLDQRIFAADPALPGVDLADALRGLATYLGHVAGERASRATAIATELVEDLAKLVADQPGVIVEDTLCERLGTPLSETGQAPPDERVNPYRLGEALVPAAEAAVEAALGDHRDRGLACTVARARRAAGPAGASAGRVRGRCDRAVARYRSRPGAAGYAGTAVSGEVLWTRDRYGSRFAVAAPIATPDCPVRWYLWDIDVCGHEAFTVRSGFYATPEAALAGWGGRDRRVRHGIRSCRRPGADGWGAALRAGGHARRRGERRAVRRVPPQQAAGRDRQASGGSARAAGGGGRLDRGHRRDRIRRVAPCRRAAGVA